MDKITKQSGSDQVEIPKSLTISKVLMKVVYYWAMFGVLVLSLRVVLLAFGANPAARFVEFIANTSANYMDPFRGIFPAQPVGTTGYLDVSAMFAIIMYLLFAWGVTSLITFIDLKIAEVKMKAEQAQASK